MVRVIEEKVVGSMHIGAVPPAPSMPYVAPYIAPPRVPVTAAARKVKQVPTKFLEEHKKIKKYIDTQGKKYLCPTTDEIVGETGLSEGDVRLHISVMEEDEAAIPVQKGDNPAICSADGLNRLVENLRKLRT